MGNIFDFQNFKCCTFDECLQHVKTSLQSCNTVTQELEHLQTHRTVQQDLVNKKLIKYKKL